MEPLASRDDSLEDETEDCVITVINCIDETPLCRAMTILVSHQVINFITLS